MDPVSRHRTGSAVRQAARRPKQPDKKSEPRGDRRRLIQLLVSLALFLMVYIGRGVFPAQTEAWREALSSSVDFQAAFQEFSRAVSEGEPVRDAFEALCVTVLGGAAQNGEGDVKDPPAPMPVEVVLLSRTRGAGVVWLSEVGVMAGNEVSPVPHAERT